MCLCFVVNDVTFVSSCAFCIFYRGARIKQIGSKLTKDDVTIPINFCMVPRSSAPLGDYLGASAPWTTTSTLKFLEDISIGKSVKASEFHSFRTSG